MPGSPLRCFIPLLTLLVLAAWPAAAAAVDLSGSWIYRESGGGESDTFREVRQNYSLGVGPSLTYQPSHALTASGTVAYTQTDSVVDGDTRTVQTIAPTLGFRLNNDLFSLLVSGTSSARKADGSDWRNSPSWSTTLASAWRQPFIPRLQLTYTEESDDSRDLAADFERNRLGFSAALDVVIAQLDYNFQQTAGDDLADTRSHFAKLETTGRFWDDRVMFSFSQQGEFTTLEAPGNAAGGAEDNPVSTGVSSALAPDDTPAGYSDDAERISGEDWLSPAPGTVSYAANQQILIAFDVDFAGRRIQAVEMSFDVLQDTGIGDSEWDLYEYQASIDTWVLVENNLTGSARQDGDGTRRLRIELPATASRFLLASNQRSTGGQLTGVEAFEVPAAGTERTSRSYQTHASTQLRISETLSSMVGLNYERDEAENEADAAAATDQERLSTNAGLNWRPSAAIGTTLSVNEFRETQSGEEQLLTRNYSLLFSTRPLETVRVNFGVQWEQRYGDELEDGSVDIDQKTLDRLRYSVNGSAQIYPDLTARFTLNYRDGERWLRPENRKPGFVDDAGRDARLDLNAKFSKRLTADLVNRYSWTESDGTTNETGSAELGLRYRVSELLLLRGSYRAELIAADNPDTLALRMLASLLATDKTRLDLQLAHTRAEEAVESVSLNGSWRVSKKASLVGRGSYVFAAGNSYNLTLNLRISI